MSPEANLAQTFLTLRKSLALLRTRRFGTFWFASLLSNIGTWAQQVAQPWLLLSLGASPFLIGLDAFAMDAPVWAFTLTGGVLADRADRRRVIAVFQSIQMLCPTLLVVLLLTGAVRPWIVICMSLIVGITDALSMPSFQSIVPSIVKSEQIASGLALNSTQFNLSRILGPALAGVLITATGVMGCFVASAVSYLPFILIALWILPRSDASRASGTSLNLHGVAAGVNEIMHDRRLRQALATVLATSFFCGPLVTFIPILVKGTFHGSAGQFSAAVSAFGIGGLVGAAGLLSVGERQDRQRLSSAFALAYGAIVALSATTPWFWSLPVLLGLAGAAMNVSNTCANTVIMTASAPGLRGQTVSLYMLAMRGGMALGGLLTGLSIGVFGMRHALLLNSALALAAHLTLYRQYRNIAPKAPADSRVERATHTPPS
ncbi:MFS transporter [Nevskia soli]|uniref:MFS transporter n=1 Tax=Nevskia soli TaxID=418856 RepID=UPI00068BE535|nr:MFS transporter [Nevskia soli]